MTPEEAQAYVALSNKRSALTAYIQRLIALTNDDNETQTSVAIEQAQMEINLISAMTSELLNGAPVDFPPAAEIQAMQQLAANLQQAVETGAVVDGLIAAASLVIQAWPRIN